MMDNRTRVRSIQTNAKSYFDRARYELDRKRDPEHVKMLQEKAAQQYLNAREAIR